MSTQPKIIAIVGPTASGKTALGIALAQRFNGEIVSTDSRQIYRGMDIGTAKPTPEERAIVPHHLIDIKDPTEDYTVADYKADAIAAIESIIARGKLPIMVGGTGLYTKAVVENLDIPKIVAQPELRAEIEEEIAREGLAAVFARLVALDPEAEYIVDPKNPRRVVRALEVALATGQPFTAQRKKQPARYDALTIGLSPAAELLREKMDRRIDEMLRAGLVDEVKALVQKYGRTTAAFDAIGYREIIAFLGGTTSLEAAAAEMKMNTWHYAKRQMTWFKKDKTVSWITAANAAEAITEALTFVNDFLMK